MILTNREYPLSQKMLAATLDYLEQEGLVNRVAQATFPPHVTDAQ